MAFSGHRTPSMLERYHIIALDDRAPRPRRAMPTAAATPPRSWRSRAEHGENAERTPRLGVRG